MISASDHSGEVGMDIVEFVRWVFERERGKKWEETKKEDGVDDMIGGGYLKFAMQELHIHHSLIHSWKLMNLGFFFF